MNPTIGLSVVSPDGEPLLEVLEPLDLSSLSVVRQWDIANALAQRVHAAVTEYLLSTYGPGEVSE